MGEAVSFEHEKHGLLMGQIVHSTESQHVVDIGGHYGLFVVKREDAKPMRLVEAFDYDPHP